MEQKQNILQILKTPDLAQKLETCLENVSCNDPIFTTLSNIFSRFPVYKPPKGIDQLDILHSMFQFSNLEDCLESFQFVCKTWQRAFETMRFEYMIIELPENWFEEGYAFNWKKVLEKFQKVDLLTICQDIEITDISCEELFQVFAANCKNLTEVELPFFYAIEPNYFDVSTKILHRSCNTLKNIQDIPLTLLLSNVTFPFLEEVRISLQSEDSVSDLQNLISSLPAVFPSIKLVVFRPPKNLNVCTNICTHLVRHHEEKFLAADTIKAIDCVSSKYLFISLSPWTQEFATNLCEYQYAHNLAYLSISTIWHHPWKEKEEIEVWKNFQNILTLPNLKMVSIKLENGMEVCSAKLVKLSPELKRIQALIKTTSIEFVRTKEIEDQFEREKKNKLIFKWQPRD